MGAKSERMCLPVFQHRMFNLQGTRGFDSIEKAEQPIALPCISKLVPVASTGPHSTDLVGKPFCR